MKQCGFIGKCEVIMKDFWLSRRLSATNFRSSQFFDPFLCLWKGTLSPI